MQKLPFELKAIAAMAENRAIGKDNALPWHIPEELKWFKECTMGGNLLMGRKTYESIGRPLPGRITYVLTRQELEIPGVVVVNDIREIPASDKTLWLAGGSELFAKFLPLCSEVFLTKIAQKPEADVFMPAFEGGFGEPTVLRENKDFTVLHYTL